MKGVYKGIYTSAWPIRYTQYKLALVASRHQVIFGWRIVTEKGGLLRFWSQCNFDLGTGLSL